MSNLTTQLAKAMFASNAGPGWGGVSKSVRETYIRAADTVIAHLTAAGRLIPAGGMALTAEQVEDVRIVTTEVGGYTGEQFRRWHAAKDRLVDALFPVTEPAEEIAEETAEPRIWGIDASEPSDVRYVRDRYGCLFEKFADNVWHRWRAGVGRFGEADWTWSELASDLPVEVLGTPPELTPPTPAEPAEEETKAERKFPADTFGEVVRIVWTTYYYGADNEWHNARTGAIETREDLIEEARTANGDWHRLVPEVSSPVVPAPTETGPWQTWQEVPEGVWVRSEGDNGWKWIKRDGVRFTSNCGCVGAYKSRLSDEQIASFAPFVAAEEG